MDLNTIKEVVRARGRDALPRWQHGDAWLGGGTWLFSEPQPHLSRLIDLTSLGWPAIETNEHGLRVAATCTVAALEATSLPVEWTAAPLIGQCCRAFAASFKIWNTATVGGNICMALPAGPMISLTCALDGIGTVWSRDGSERRIPIFDFVTGAKRNALAPGEILRAIDLPAQAFMRSSAFRQISLTPFGRSSVLLIGTLSPHDGAFTLTVTAATSRPVKLSFASLPDRRTLRDRIEHEIPDALYYDDVHGAPRWRKHVTPVLAEEILQELSGDTAL